MCKICQNIFGHLLHTTLFYYYQYLLFFSFNVKNIYLFTGAGPAGLSFATTAARRGHHVTLYDQSKDIGGQFNMAKKIPGKEEFYETLRYFQARLELDGKSK